MQFFFRANKKTSVLNDELLGSAAGGGEGGRVGRVKRKLIYARIVTRFEVTLRALQRGRWNLARRRTKAR